MGLFFISAATAEAAEAAAVSGSCATREERGEVCLPRGEECRLRLGEVEKMHGLTFPEVVPPLGSWSSES